MTVKELQAESKAKIAEANFRIAVIERDNGLCICGKQAVDVHHILGRKKPRGWKSLPEPLKSLWPHVPMNGICLCKGGHWWVGEAGKHARPLLLAWLMQQHGTKWWEGNPYWKWLSAPPFHEFLFGVEEP